MSELKPCPLCGKEVLWVSGSIRCLCGLRYDPPVVMSKEAAEKRWNTRAERTCETCPQMDNPDSFIRHLIGCETREKFYAVKTWNDLDDWGVSYIERKLYRTREEAERRVEEVEAWSDDVGWYALVEKFEVVES